MKLPNDLGQLTYCLNIHPTQSFDEVMAALTGPVLEVKRAISPVAPFTVGLRFSGVALTEAADPANRARLKSALADNALQALTVNGFPYGPFHGVRVKEEVYQPDWRSAERLRYTCALADLMAELAPAGATVSLSTVPGTFRPLATDAEDAMAEMLLRAVAHVIALRDRVGTTVALAIEPEPACFLETIAETCAFFETMLFSDKAVRWLAELAGVSLAEAAAALPRHLGLCYDVCHAAVEFEDPAGSIAMLLGAGIPIHKLQLSSALRVARVGPETRAALARFDEPTYLHQVVRRTPQGLKRMTDLPEALALGADADGEEWRVHFHVPVFSGDMGELGSTRAFLEDVLALHRRDPISPHLEVETYTWDVLPPALRGESIADDVTREMRWVLEALGA